MHLPDILNMIWPLVTLLLILIFLWRIEKELKPVVNGVIVGLASNAQQKAIIYAMGTMYAMAASLQALGEVATGFGWLGLAAFAKVAQPGVVAIIAYANKMPDLTKTGVTVPPFTPSTPPTP